MNDGLLKNMAAHSGFPYIYCQTELYSQTGLQTALGYFNTTEQNWAQSKYYYYKKSQTR